MEEIIKIIDMPDASKFYRGVISGYWFAAKVYEIGSKFGIDGGRISKLEICKGEKWDSKKVVYQYDRELVFNNCPPDILKNILDSCYNLIFMDDNTRKYANN